MSMQQLCYGQLQSCFVCFSAVKTVQHIKLNGRLAATFGIILS